jgi:hypothetical protein
VSVPQYTTAISGTGNTTTTLRKVIQNILDTEIRTFDFIHVSVTELQNCLQGNVSVHLTGGRFQRHDSPTDSPSLLFALLQQ